MYPHLNLNTDTDIYIYVLADTDNSGPISSFHPQLRACTGCNVWPCGGTRQAWHLWSSGRLVAGAGTLLAAWCIGGWCPWDLPGSMKSATVAGLGGVLHRCGG
jgi:hypothetical protein